MKSSSATPPSGTVTGLRLRRHALVPRDHVVGARRHVVDAVAAVGVGQREERMAEHEDERVHVRVDVAEHAHDAGPVEAHRLGAAGGVAAEIERPRLRERKHVVVDAVAVGEVDDRAGGDRQHVRHERLVALIHHGVARFVCLERAARRRLEVDDRPQAIGEVARRRRAEVGDGWPPLAGGAARRSSTRPRIVPFRAAAPAWPRTTERATATAKKPRRRARQRRRRVRACHQNQNTTCAAPSVSVGTRPPSRVLCWHDTLSSRLR